MNQALDAFQLVGKPVASSDVPVKQVDVFLIAAQMGGSNKLRRRLHPSDSSMPGPIGKVSISGTRWIQSEQGGKI